MPKQAGGRFELTPFKVGGASATLPKILRVVTGDVNDTVIPSPGQVVLHEMWCIRSRAQLARRDELLFACFDMACLNEHVLLYSGETVHEGQRYLGSPFYLSLLLKLRI